VNWFEQLFGFREHSPDQVRSFLRAENGVLHSSANGSSFRHGQLTTPSLAELREQSASLVDSSFTSVSEVVADVQQLHLDPENEGALFQVASQFNLLEMTGPSVTPEQGIGIYQFDRTQGPACAIACGAATVFRNYFVELEGQIGQSENLQIDCLAELGQALGNIDDCLWAMLNGYALPSSEGLEQIVAQIAACDPPALDKLRGALRIGVQHAAEVTLEPRPTQPNLVSQAFCSALPVAYSRLASDRWEPFARLVLEAAYEATLLAAALNREQTGCERVFLTLLGGGAFGNRCEWIVDAIERAITRVESAGLDIRIVSYASPTPDIRRLLTDDYVVRAAEWADDAEALMSVRTTVFVEEQNVPVELERDGLDPSCRHAIAFAHPPGSPGGEAEPVGVGRITSSGHIGRVAVLPAWRGRGVGTALIRNLMVQSESPVFDLNAQSHAVAFYQRLGFVAEGPEFEEAGIPHRRMVYVRS